MKIRLLKPVGVFPAGSEVRAYVDEEGSVYFSGIVRPWRHSKLKDDEWEPVITQSDLDRLLEGA